MPETTRMSSRWSLPVVLALAMVAGLMTTAPATAATVGVPTDLSPAGTVTNASSVLMWSRVTEAPRYEVQVSASAAFTPLLYSTSTTNSRAVPTSLLPSGTVHWRVRAIAASGLTGEWANQDFTVSATAPPTPATPADGETLPQPQSPPLLSWQAVPGAVNYVVDVDTDGDFIGASSYTTKSTSLVVPDPKAGGTYTWRVRAQLSNNLYTEYSTPWKYQIGSLQEVSIVSPVDGENTAVEDVVLEWRPVPGAKTYDLLVSTDQDFNNLVDTKTNLKSTRYSPLTTYLNDQYFWKVRARNNLGETIEWSNVGVHNFRRHWPQQPVLQYPADALSPAVGGDFHYQWSPVEHATRYQLDVGSDPNFSPGTYVSCYTAGTTYTTGASRVTGGSNDACSPSEGVVRYWRVRGLDDPAGVQGIYSEIHRFIYDSGRVAQVSPASGATVAVPTLTWQPTPAAERYRVIVTGQGGSPHIQTDTYALSWTPTGAQGLDPAKSPYTWTVQSIAANGSVSPLPAGRTFSIEGAAPSTGTTPLEPLAGDGDAATTRFPNLTWEPMSGAAYYRVKIGLSGTGYWLPVEQSDILTLQFPYPTATDVDKGLLAPGDYDWLVEAYNKDGAKLGSSPRLGSFTILDLNKVGGQQIALSGTSLDADQACKAYLDAPATEPSKCVDVPTTPVLDWVPVPGASFYMVYVAQDRELTNRVYTGIPTVNTRWTPDWDDIPRALADSQAGQAYYWFVRPCKAVNVCAPDPVSTTQSAGHAFNKKSPAVKLLAPTQDATLPDAASPSKAIAFTWDDYLATNQGTVFEYSPGVGEASVQTAKQYRVQVSQSSSFATTIDDRVVDQATYAPYLATYPEGPLYWRVQAIDPHGNALTWSAPQRFTKASPAPKLTWPIGGAVTSGVDAFRWEPTDFAGSYQLEVYKENDTSLSPVNRVVNFTSKQTAYANATPLPASAKPYLWRVARLDADNRPGQWSAVESFLSQGLNPTPTAPDAGAEVSGYNAYFAWSAVAGAVKYRFERKAAGASAVVESVTTAALGWAPISVIATGQWSWRVTALDVNNNAIGTSAWRDFSVDSAKGQYNPITPTRVLDTRTGLGASKRQVGPGGTITLAIPGLPSSATAVALNVTASRPTATSFLTVYPYGQTRPNASNLNFVKGQTVPNMVTVTVGSGGRVSFYNSAGSVDLIADLAGYYTPEGGSGYTARSPKRVLDTRSGLGAARAKIPAGGSVVLEIPNLPADTKAVAMNVTAAAPTATSYLTVYPTGATRPNASNLNFVAGQTVPNMVVVAVGAGGRVTLFNAAGSVDVLADLAGYFTPTTTSALFKGQTPKRVLDTRSGIGASKAVIGPSGTVTLAIPGLPTGTTAVILNVTATGPTATSYATVYPADQPQPTASNLNYVKGQTIPNMVMGSVGAGGKVKFFNATGSVNLIADLAGAYIVR